MKIRLHDMKWTDVEELLRKPHVLLIPVGAVEQHARHLPLNVDSRSATHMAERAAEKV
ncbi:MAG: creatininase family protein, partial [Deltaproteobacteria bacterium]|nr:creatininase family protein [Deltaproteobacteria bacterium]